MEASTDTNDIQPLVTPAQIHKQIEMHAHPNISFNMNLDAR